MGILNTTSAKSNYLFAFNKCLNVNITSSVDSSYHKAMNFQGSLLIILRNETHFQLHLVEFQFILLMDTYSDGTFLLHSNHLSSYKVHLLVGRYRATMVSYVYLTAR